MSWLTKKQATAALKEQRAIQDRIVKRLGLKKLEEAKKRLCDVCSVGSCDLLPLIGQGEDCSYFERKEMEK